MSHAQGRFGYRDARSPRNGHSNASSSQPTRKPAIQTPPVTRDFAEVANALMVRNFKMLVDVAGAQNLAVALDLTDKRIAEIESGGFTVETAHYIETTLGLPGGFIGQVNPQLAADVIARLKSPLQSKITEAEETPEPVADPADKPANEVAVPPVQLHLVPKTPINETAPPQVVEQVQTVQPQESDMAKSAPAKTPAKKAATSTSAAKPTAAQQSLLPDSVGGNIEDVRRENLKMLTSRLGSKGILCSMMGMSGANLSHRLTGLKKFDDAEAENFTSKLGLPHGWLDTPHTEKQVPSKVAAALAPDGENAGMKPAKTSTKEPAAKKAASTAEDQATKPAAKKAAAKTIKPRERVLAPADISAPRLSASVLGRKSSPSTTPAPSAAPVAKKRAAASQPSVPAAARQAEIESSAATAVAEAPVHDPAPGAMTVPAVFANAAAMPVVTQEELQAIGPIAFALIRTLAMKARDNRIDEMKALALLQEIAAL